MSEGREMFNMSAAFQSQRARTLRRQNYLPCPLECNGSLCHAEVVIANSVKKTQFSGRFPSIVCNTDKSSASSRAQQRSGVPDPCARSSQSQPLLGLTNSKFMRTGKASRSD